MSALRFSQSIVPKPLSKSLAISRWTSSTKTVSSPSSTSFAFARIESNVADLAVGLGDADSRGDHVVDQLPEADAIGLAGMASDQAQGRDGRGIRQYRPADGH